MKELLKKFNTLKIKFTVITFCTYMILVAVTLVACYNHFFQNMLVTYESLGDEILNHAADDINIDHIPDYLSGDYDKEEYATIQEELNHYVDYYDEIYYLYGYKINEGSDVATVIFDAATDHDTEDKLGDDYELEQGVYDQIDKLERGEPIGMLVDNTKWGYLMTCSKPLIDSKGKCQGYLFVDFNLSKAKQDDINFILELFFIIFLIVLFILFFVMRAVERRITGPIEKMYLCLKSFKFDTNADREANIEKLCNLDIHTNQEIQSLYNTLISTTLESYTYQQEYQVATEKLGVASEMAFKDALTGMRNKNAYENEVKAIEQKLEAGEEVELSVLMLDINNLKYVNDTFGHTKGDVYINGCCKIAKDLCVHSYIYRLGGDEFIVLLKGEDHKNRQSIYIDLVKAYGDAFSDETKEPWERYSASVGMAERFPYDRRVADIVKRADSAMYRAKSEFKEKYGSYR